MSIGTTIRLPTHRDMPTSGKDFDGFEGDLWLFALAVDEGGAAGEGGGVHALGVTGAFVDDDVDGGGVVEEVFRQGVEGELVCVFLDQTAENVGGCVGFGGGHAGFGGVWRGRRGLGGGGGLGGGLVLGLVLVLVLVVGPGPGEAEGGRGGDQGCEGADYNGREADVDAHFLFVCLLLRGKTRYE